MRDLTLEEINGALLNIHYALEGFLHLFENSASNAVIKVDQIEAMLNPYVSALHTVSMSLADKIDEGTIKEIK